MAPLPFDPLRLITGRAEPVDNLKNSVGEPIRWYFSAVIELNREQHRVPPPFAGHTLAFR